MKKLVFMLAALLVVTMAVGCSDKAPVESAWEVTIGTKVYPIEELKEMDAVTFDAEKKEEVNSYTGVLLSDLLTEAGITEFETLTLEAEDGYTCEITKEEALADSSVLCYAKDGGELDSEKSAPLMFVSKATSTKAWVGKLKSVQIGE